MVARNFGFYDQLDVDVHALGDQVHWWNPGEEPNAGSTPNFTWAAGVIRPCVVAINAIRSASLPMPVVDPNGARFIDPFEEIQTR